MKMKEFGPWGVHVPAAPLGSANDNVVVTFNIIVHYLSFGSVIYWRKELRHLPAAMNLPKPYVFTHFCHSANTEGGFAV